MRELYYTSLALLVIGGLNWGLIGAFEFDLVAALFGPMSLVSRLIYVVVGLSALYVAASAFSRKPLEYAAR